MLRVWNLSLVCATFSLTILGTFLTRSGVIRSVHAFSEGSIGPLLLAFFALVVVVSVGLVGWRGDQLRSPGRIDSPVSREGAFLVNNVAFAAFAFIVLLGTVFPLIVEAVDGRPTSVGGQYFDRMTMPVALGLLFLMAVAPVLPWRLASAETLRQRLLVPAWFAAGSLVVAVALGARGLAPLVAFGLAGLAGGSALRQVFIATRRHGWRGFVGRANGGMIVHLGVVLVAVGYAASASFVADAEFQVVPGETVEVGSHTATYLGVNIVERDEKVSTVADISVDGGQVYQPSINRFRNGQVIGEPSVRPSLGEDVYLTLVAPPDPETGEATIRVIVQPLVSWLWIGGAVMGLGTVLALFPGRRRDPLSAAGATASGGAAAGPAPRSVDRPRAAREPAEVG